jgi:hypothetical protein
MNKNKRLERENWNLKHNRGKRNDKRNHTN